MELCSTSVDLLFDSHEDAFCAYCSERWWFFCCCYLRNCSGKKPTILDQYCLKYCPELKSNDTMKPGEKSGKYVWLSMNQWKEELVNPVDEEFNHSHFYLQNFFFTSEFKSHFPNCSFTYSLCWLPNTFIGNSSIIFAWADFIFLPLCLFLSDHVWQMSYCVAQRLFIPCASQRGWHSNPLSDSHQLMVTTNLTEMQLVVQMQGEETHVYHCSDVFYYL